jgi:hypothetical protein
MTKDQCFAHEALSGLFLPRGAGSGAANPSADLVQVLAGSGDGAKARERRGALGVSPRGVRRASGTVRARGV